MAMLNNRRVIPKCPTLGIWMEHPHAQVAGGGPEVPRRDG
jgi:hypothetical protein